MSNRHPLSGVRFSRLSVPPFGSVFRSQGWEFHRSDESEADTYACKSISSRNGLRLICTLEGELFLTRKNVEVPEMDDEQVFLDKYDTPDQVFEAAERISAIAASPDIRPINPSYYPGNYTPSN